MVRVGLYYHDLSVTYFVETEVYPLSEMLNELTGIIGLYFGFSMLTVAALCAMAFKRIGRRKESKSDAVMSLALFIRSVIILLTQ